ncbi:MAG: PQQ-binding-like beta-propeller repeat protein [Planctomycetota bacterium]|nr:PQQ-binding-like beta-propeller repeat protein [Planctomycetota bacterium]
MVEFGPDDWPMWRGTGVDGVATGPEVPTAWSDKENIVWKSDIPGRGHSSPIILGDRIFLETADEQAQTQSVVAFDRSTGKEVWRKQLFTGGFEGEMHRENTQATSTIATDGQQLFATFLNNKKIWAVALNLEGKELWRREVGGFAAKFGYSASPTLYGSLVLIAADHQKGGFLAGLNRENGAIVWRKSRPALSSYASPRVVKLGGKDQLVICGCNLVASFDPLTGEKNWETPGTADAGVGTIVTSGEMVFASGGYPQAETIGLNADGTVAWRNKSRSYCPSLLAVENCVYQLDDDGIVRCFEATRGTKKWEQRVGGKFRVSPIVSGGNIFVTDMSGKTTVFRANPEKYELVAQNTLGTEGFASPAVSGGRLYLRTATGEGKDRKETLYCIGSAK